MKIGGRAHNIGEAEQIAKMGFPFVEISVIDSLKFFKEEFETLKRIKEEYGVFYLAHGPEEGNAWEPEILKKKLLPELKLIIDCLPRLAIKIFTIHFWMDERFIDKSVIKDKLLLLSEISSYASDKGIILCIENLSESWSDFLYLFEKIDPLKMTLDIGHGELLSKENRSYGFINKCPDRIKHVHIHDNFGGDSPEDDLHLPLGDGNIDFSSILLDLKGKGYDNNITLEVKPENLVKGKKIIEEILLSGSKKK